MNQITIKIKMGIDIQSPFHRVGATGFEPATP